jgi:hypothetical protein
VWPLGVVVFSPFLDDDLRTLGAVEYLSIEQFIPEAGIKTFAVSVLPW